MKMMIDLSKAGISDVLEQEEIPQTEDVLRRLQERPPLSLPPTRSEAEEIEDLVRRERTYAQMIELVGSLGQEDDD